MAFDRKQTIFDSLQELNTFMKAVMEFHNAVPKWALMGRTSYEVSGNRGKTTVAKMPIKKNKFKS